MYYNKKKLAVSIMWIVLGTVCLVLDMAGIIDNSILAGIGGGWIGVGIMQVVKNLKYHNDEIYKEKIDIAAKDERNSYLRMKAWSWAGYMYVMGAAVVSIICFAIGQSLIGQVICFSMCAVLILFWVSYIVLGKKY